MRQIIFTFHLFGFSIPLYGYGLMLVIAFFGCLKTSQWLARHSGINPELFVNAVLIALVSGLVGARICHVLENLGQFTRGDLSITQNLANMVNIREGGLTFYGGFIFATPCCILYARLNKVPILRGMDITAPLVMIGLGFGRIGCFLNGCCYGQVCTPADASWGVAFPYYSSAYIDQYDNGLIPTANIPLELRVPRGNGKFDLLNPNSDAVRKDKHLQEVIRDAPRALPVYPTQLYSSFTAFLLAGLLIAYYTLPHLAGRVFALMLMLEGLSRYVLELIRVEPAVWFPTIGGHTYALSISMILGWLSVFAGIGMWGLLGAIDTSRSRPDVAAPVAPKMGKSD